jgi:hypothetical protein
MGTVPNTGKKIRNQDDYESFTKDRHKGPSFGKIILI